MLPSDGKERERCKRHKAFGPCFYFGMLFQQEMVGLIQECPYKGIIRSSCIVQ